MAFFKKTPTTKPSSLIEFKPNSFKEVKTISKELIENNAVLINLTDLQIQESVRLIDFLSGVILVLDGRYKKVSPKTYLLAPSETILNKFLDKLNG